MGLFDSLGIKTAAEAVDKLAPLLDNAESRIRDIAREEIGRLNGASLDISIIDNKIHCEVTFPPPTPPGVRGNLPEGFRG